MIWISARAITATLFFGISMAYVAGYASMDTFTDKASARIGLAIAAMVWCAVSTVHDRTNLHALQPPLKEQRIDRRARVSAVANAPVLAELEGSAGIRRG